MLPIHCRDPLTAGLLAARLWRSLALLACALPLALLPACDNPACIYGGNCSQGSGGGGGGGGGSESNVVFPEDGQWVVDGAPRLEAFFPGSGASASSPVLMVFNESLNPASLQGAYRLAQQASSGDPPPASTPAPVLLGEGRALVLLPSAPLTPGANYQVQYSTSASVRDLTGVLVTKPANNVAGSFSVTTQPQTSPRVVGSFPRSGTSGNSPIGEIVVVFDRPMDASTINVSSFVVTVDDELLDPPTPPQALASTGSGPSDTRVWRWRALDEDGAPRALPAGARVRAQLSPSGGGTIRDSAGNALASTTVDFTLAPFSPPLRAEILTDPSDAFGIEHLAGALPLMIEVELAEPTQAGDELGILLFGTGLTSGVNSFFQRSFAPAPGSSTIVVDRDDLQLATSVEPLQTLFADGEVAFAWRLRRGNVVSPVRVLDVDSAAEGIQDPLQDTLAPEVLSLGSSPAQDGVFRSDLHDLAVVGRASEVLRGAEVAVSAEVGGSRVTVTNGTRPEVVGAAAGGLFVAKPIPGETFEGLADLPLTLSMRVYDRALNPSPDLTVSYFRRGLVGGGQGLGDNVLVRAYDAIDVRPIAGAAVFLHIYLGVPGVGGNEEATRSAGPFFTDAQGVATVFVPSVGTSVITVDASGYDLFSFHGVSTGVLDVPLHAAGIPTAAVRAAINAPPLPAGAEVQGSDTRRAAIRSNPLVEMPCSQNPLTLEVTCIAVPDGDAQGYLVGAHRLGGFGFLAIDTPVSLGAFDPSTFLLGFRYFYPQPSLAPTGQSPVVGGTLPSFFSTSTPVEERPIGVPATRIDASDVGGLSRVPTPPQPRVRVETTSPAVPDPVVVGLGVSFDANEDQVWDLRAAYPGDADPIANDGNDALGRLVREGAIDASLLLSIELEDVEGSRTVVRAPVGLTAPPLPLVPVAVPILLSPSSGTGGPAYRLVVPDVLPPGFSGLYSVTVSESDGTTVGRSWRLWRTRTALADGQDLRLEVPDIGALGGMPLTGGQLVVVVSVASYPTLELGNFTWSELPRRRQLFASTRPSFLSNP